MKRSKILMIAAAAALLILLITAVVILKGDGTGPSITIPSGIEYRKGMSDSELLKGVTADDSKDGDVSDTLIVESVIILSSGDSVKITYAAKDKHNNITQKSIILPYKAPAEEPTKSPEVTKSADNKESSKEAGNETPHAQEETTTGYPEETTPVQTESPDAPVLYLTKIEDWIKKGSQVNWIKYVSDITDDKDERNALFQSIMIDNYPDMNTVGDYDMQFYCKDSDGNFSPKITLHIHITD